MGQLHEQIDEVRRQVAWEASPASKLTRRQTYWRSLGDLLKQPSFTKWAHDEFPQMAQELSLKEDGTSRRRFLQIMGASMALAGLTASGCRRPETKIRPYTKKPVDIVIGKGMYYATTFVLSGRPMGVLVETHEGRPTKIEGNPLHPNSLGGTDLFAQASILGLYDPERSREYSNLGNPVSREQFVAQIDNLGKQLKASQGDGLAILLNETNSPAVEMILAQAAKSLPQAKSYAYDAANPSLGRGQTVYDFSKAKVIVSLDADIFGLEDEGVRYRRQFIDGRRNVAPGEMNQLYVIESGFSQTGAIADHRLPLRPSQIRLFAEALLATLQGAPVSGLDRLTAKWIAAVAEALQMAGSNGLVVAGARQGSALQGLAYLINNKIGAFGRSVWLRDRGPHGNITQLCESMGNGTVKTLVIIGGNPGYDAPADLKFVNGLKNVPLSIHLGLYRDETGAACTWHAPQTHYLESWGDAASADGTLSVIQPMVEPLFGGMSALELLARISLFAKTDPYEITRLSFSGDELAWRQFVQEGVCKGTLPARVAAAFVAEKSPEIPADSIDVAFALDPSVYDGRFANNAWLQECPDPVTKLTWDNAALLAPALARKLGVDTGDLIRIDVNDMSVQAPVYVIPGHADNAITLPLGYGRSSGGSIAQGAGVNAYALRTTTSLGFATGAKVTKVPGHYPLATTQEHWAFDLDKHFASVGDEAAKERAIIREVTPEELASNPAVVKQQGEHAPIHLNVYTSPPLTGANQWGMAVDLNACVGCNACVIACQSENNVPVVGKDEVIRGREMHWLRLDRYFAGDGDQEGGDVKATLQPMMCQHCENAPCEPVCPVNATVHSPEGLNEMVYNRCIGTRYCSNNCPYKVRRFNYFDWNKGTLIQQTAPTRDGQIQPVPTQGWSRPQVMQPPLQQTLQMQKNPNVTVRMRGVMEKCTFCVQRIESAKIAARSAVGQQQATMVDGKPVIRVADGAVTSACAQACPTQAITFGDISDPNSRVSKLHADSRSYQVLEHLNVRPRTQYLAKVRNLNPKLGESQ